MSGKRLHRKKNGTEYSPAGAAIFRAVCFYAVCMAGSGLGALRNRILRASRSNRNKDRNKESVYGKFEAFENPVPG